MFGWLARLLNPQIPRGEERERQGWPRVDAREREWCKYLIRTEPIQRLGNPRLEVGLADRSRCDILTTSAVWEVDFARKWREGISQALLYGSLARRPSGLILLCSRARDRIHVQRAKQVLSELRPEIRPRLLLCNMHNGQIEDAMPPVVDATIVAETPSTKETGHRLAGCLLLLVGVCCRPYLLVFFGNSPQAEQAPQDYHEPEPATAPIVATEPPAAPNSESTPHTVEGGPISVDIPTPLSSKEPSKADDRSQDQVALPTTPSRQEAGPVSCPPAPAVAGMRTWTDSSGKYTVEAEFVDFEDGQVRLKKRDGKVIPIALKRLSVADRKHLQAKFGIELERKPVFGRVTAVGDKRLGLCEIHFTDPVDAFKGQAVELYRDGVLIGAFRVVAARGQDVVAENAILRAKVGDEARIVEPPPDGLSP